MNTYSHNFGQAAIDRPGMARHPSVETEARNTVAGNSLFRGRMSNLEFVFDSGSLVITGKLPSFYLKQVLQTIVTHINGIEKIDNRVEVVSCPGLSGPTLEQEKSV